MTVMAKDIHTGGCLCGWIKFEALGPVDKPHTCSCKMCQRHTGALTAAWIEFPKVAVTWVGAGGEPSSYRSSDFSSRAFCSKCGSSVGALDDKPVVALLVGTLDKTNRKALKPAYHSYRSGVPKWWCVEVTSET
jgi:hypothetical protein